MELLVVPGSGFFKRLYIIPFAQFVGDNFFMMQNNTRSYVAADVTDSKGKVSYFRLTSQKFRAKFNLQQEELTSDINHCSILGFGGIIFYLKFL